MTNHYDMPPEIQITAEGALRVITINPPVDLNASTTEMLLAFAHLFAARTLIENQKRYRPRP